MTGTAGDRDWTTPEEDCASVGYRSVSVWPFVLCVLGAGGIALYVAWEVLCG